MQRATTESRARQTLWSHSAKVVVAALIYLAILHYTYEHNIAPFFSYLRYSYREPDPLTYAFTVSLVVALALILPRRITQPSHFIVWVLFTVAVVPSIVVPQYSEVLTVRDATELAVWVAVSYLPVATLGTRGALQCFLPRIQLSATAFWFCVFILFSIICIYLVGALGVRTQLPSLLDVYGVRAELKTDEAYRPPLNYVVPLLANVLNPIMMVRGLRLRRWGWLLVGVVGQVFIYSFSGNKTAILSPLALVAVYFLFRRTCKPFAAATLFGASVLSTGMVLMDWMTSSVDWTSLIVRRSLITPGLLTAAYVAVFSDIEKAKFAHSFLSPFLRYPYAEAPPLLVGRGFFGHPGTSANANLMADGYANFGFAGMTIECLVLVLLLWAIDDAARNIPLGVSSAVCLMPTLALADSGIFTSMLTHGFLATVLAFMCMPRLGWNREGRAPGGRRTTPNERSHPLESVPVEEP